MSPEEQKRLLDWYNIVNAKGIVYVSANGSLDAAPPTPLAPPAPAAWAPIKELVYVDERLSAAEPAPPLRCATCGAEDGYTAFQYPDRCRECWQRQKAEQDAAEAARYWAWPGRIIGAPRRGIPHPLPPPPSLNTSPHARPPLSPPEGG